jgi:hypothetical protein
MVMILERDHTRTTFVFDIKFVFIPSDEMQVNLEFEVFDFYRSILMPLNYELTQPMFVL